MNMLSPGVASYRQLGEMSGSDILLQFWNGRLHTTTTMPQRNTDTLLNQLEHMMSVIAESTVYLMVLFRLDMLNMLAAITIANGLFISPL